MQIRTAIVALLAVVPALGQETGDAGSKRDEILAAIELPAAAQALRSRGVEKEQVREALRAAKSKRLKARNAKALLDESAKSVDENGKIDNFGAFVKSKLDEGLRGRDLAAAIHAEHKKRGKGKGRSMDRSKGKSDDKSKGMSDDRSKGKSEDRSTGKPDDKSKGKARGSEDESDEPGHGKRPDDKGRPEEGASGKPESAGGGSAGGGKGKGKGKGKPE